MRSRRRHVAVTVALVLLVFCASSRGQERSTLFNDHYQSLELGMLSSGVIGALTEYHYLPAAAYKGNWVVSTFRTEGSQRAWRVIGDVWGERFIQQTYTAASAERTYMHPMIVAGHELWRDYEVETMFAPDVEDDGMSGVLFRYRNDRRYYFAGVMGQRAVLKKVDQGIAFRKLNETILAEKPLAWKPGEMIRVKISADAEQLDATIGGVSLRAKDVTFSTGRIGFTSDMPTRFGPITVTCSKSESTRLGRIAMQLMAAENFNVNSNPKMVLWKKFDTRGFGVSRNLRFGDLNGDGKIDVLIPQQKRHGPGDSYSEVGCLTAMTVDGERLWQNGLADSWNDKLTNDVAVQIHDLDGDGKNEVVYCRDFQIVVGDGATGETKYSAPTPETPKDPDPLRRAPRFPRILGDSMAFADLRGTGHKRDIILKDRYRNIWAFNDKLEQLWTLKLNTGHYPFPHDVDGDGRDEIAVGYSLVSPDGKVIFTNEKSLEDHADGVAIVKLKDDGEKRLYTAASDEGFFITDLSSGKILKHYQIGHVQTLSVGNYRPDLPGLEIATSNFWGNQGIMHFFDADGNLYNDIEPAQHGSPMLPVNWTGDGVEFWALSPHPIQGGLFDGQGRRVVRFPGDGHPDMCTAVLDLTGDCRDEIVVWDPWEIWVYTQSDGPRKGKLYKPVRNPQCNDSNYRATISLPGWSE